MINSVAADSLALTPSDESAPSSRSQTSSPQPHRRSSHPPTPWTAQLNDAHSSVETSPRYIALPDRNDESLSVTIDAPGRSSAIDKADTISSDFWRDAFEQPQHGL